MEYIAMATNNKTGESYNLGYFPNEEEAWWNVKNNLVWDDDDNPDDYSFDVIADCDDDWEFNEDCGFDPYEGCYTYDC